MDERMVGDSLKVFVKVIFNSDLGERIEMEHVLDVIIDWFNTKMGNLINVIQTYQMYKVNKNTKSLRG